MNTRERAQLTQETGFGPATVVAWDKGRRVADSTDVCLTNAAIRCGLLEKRECNQKKAEVAP